MLGASCVKECISNTSPMSCTNTEQGKAAVGLVNSQLQNRSGGLRAPGLPCGGTGALDLSDLGGRAACPVLQQAQIRVFGGLQML